MALLKLNFSKKKKKSDTSQNTKYLFFECMICVFNIGIIFLADMLLKLDDESHRICIFLRLAGNKKFR